MIGAFWRWTSSSRPHWRESKVEAAVLFAVFGVTGSSTLFFVRPALTAVGIEGSLIDGPNSYRVVSLFTVTPIYCTILFSLGTLAGRHNYFAGRAAKMLSRFGIKKEALVCEAARTKAKGKA